MKRYKAILAAIALFAGFTTASAQEIPLSQMLKGLWNQRMGDFNASSDNYKSVIKADPSAIEPRIRLARLYMVFGEIEQALRLLDDGLTLRQNDKELLTLKSRVLILADRPDEAATVAVLAANNGGGPDSFELAVRLLMSEGKLEEALELTAGWLKVDKGYMPHFDRGLILYDLKRLDQAIEEFKAAQELNPANINVMQALGEALSERGQTDEALKLFKGVIEANPHQWDVRAALIELLIRKNDRAAAGKELLEAEKWVIPSAGAKTTLALLYLELGSIDPAVRILEGIKPEERDDRAWFFLGSAKIVQKKYQEALDALEKVKPDGPFASDVDIRKAGALKGLGKTEEAFKIVESRYNADPKDPGAVVNLSVYLNDAGRTDDAIQLLEKYLGEVNSNDVNMLYNLGNFYDTRGDWKKAIEIMEKIVTISPMHAHALNYIGYTYAEHDENLDYAEKVTKKALELLPGNGFIHDSLGWVYYKQKNYTQAVEMLRKALVSNPDDAVIWDHLGDALAKSGEREEAIKAYKKALELDPKLLKVKEKLDAPD